MYQEKVLQTLVIKMIMSDHLFHSTCFYFVSNYILIEFSNLAFARKNRTHH